MPNDFQRAVGGQLTAPAGDPTILELLAAAGFAPASAYHGFHESGPDIGDPDTVRCSTRRGFEPCTTVGFDF
jgi:hypothetical protein